jgi:hypothetical protein
LDSSVVTFLTIGALGAGVSAAVRLWELNTAPALDRAWSEAARRVGGRALIEPATFWSRAIRRLKVDVEGVALTIDTFYEGGKSGRHYTRLRAGPLPGLSRADLGVEPRTVLTSLTRRLMLGETPTGDEAFDAAFRVMSSPEGLGPALLDARTRALALRWQEGFVIEGRTLSIVTKGLPEEAEPLVGMVRYGRALVERWVALARAPAAAADALGLGPVEARLELASDGPTRVASETRQGRQLTLSVHTDRPGCLTLVSVDAPGGATFTLDRRPGRLASEGEVPSYARAIAQGAPPSLIRVLGEPGRVTLVLVGLEHDRHELEGLVGALLDVTRAKGGAYR